MLWMIALASFALTAIQGDAAPGTSILHIKVSTIAADERPVPVARHALLISDDPPTSAPLRVVTKADGTAEIRLRAGNYVVESDQPSVVQGRAYEWTQYVTVVAGRDATLELTSANASVGAASVGAEAAPTPAATNPASALFDKWQDRVVALWTEHRHAAGFIVDAKGLIATSNSAIGDAMTVEVQLSATDKVAGRVVATDPPHDVAVVQIDPAVATGTQPVPLACGAAADVGLPAKRELLTFEVPLVGTKSATRGAVIDAGAQIIDTDFSLPATSAGGPVFAGDGPAVGLTSTPQSDDSVGSGLVRVVRAAAICELVATAEQRVAGTPAPSGAHLPVEPSKPLALGDMESAASARGFSLSSYSSSSPEFDILFITPALRASAESQQGRTGGINDTFSGLRAVTEFGEWSNYVSESPPVLFIRAMPKLVESFWMKFARGAAMTQGAAIPPIKHVGAGFSRMRVLCGNTEITPVHPFKIRTRVSDTDAVDEGFYAFDPAAIGPQCSTVSLVLSSMKDPTKTETRVVDPAVIAQVWKDFATYRDQ